MKCIDFISTEVSVIVSAAPYNSPRRPALLRTPAFVVLLAVVVSIAFAFLGVKAARPFVLASDLRARNDALERQWKQYKIQNQRDERDMKALETREGIVLAARKLGYVLPGERKMRVPEHATR